MELVVDEAVGPLRWVAEQYAVRLDVLGRVLRRDRRRPRPVVARWRRAGLVEQGRVAPSADPMVWPTRAGLRAAGWRCPAKPPPLRLLAHLHAVSLVRLGIEAAGGAWTPERALYRERPEPDAHVPDARFRVGRGVPTAVEVELTNKGPARLRAIVDELTRSYAKRWRDNFAGRFAWSAIFRRFLLSSGLGAVGGRLAGRSLALFAVSRLRAPSLPPA